MPRLRWIAFLAVLLAAYGCGGDRAQDNADEDRGAAKNHADVRLSEAEQQSAGIETEPAVLRDIPRSLESSGWLIAPSGGEAIVRAPVAGFFTPESGAVEIGAEVAAKQTLGEVRVVVSPQERAQLVVAKEETDILINQSLVTLRRAEEQLAKLRDTTQSVVAGTRMAELQETVDRSRIAYLEAKEKLPFLPKEPYSEDLDIPPVDVAAPIAGRVTAQHVASRQFVVAGDPLYTVADLSKLWVRVPVFAGDLSRIETTSTATVDVPGTASPADAKPVRVVQTPGEGRRTIELFYELANISGELRPGQPVRLQLPLRGGPRSKIVVPQSAVLWDSAGHPWVYVRSAPESFVRHRIELGMPAGSSVVVVDRGLNVGEEVVTVGAESLYGAEFEEQLEAGDDD